MLSEEGEEDVSKITNALREGALDTAGRHKEQKNKKLKSKTKNLFRIKRGMIERGTPRTNI